VPAPDPSAPARYRRLHAAIQSGLVRACHDVSEGGLAVALAELCIAGRLGIEVDALPHHDSERDHDLTTALFAESLGRHMVEVAAADLGAFESTIGEPVHVLGRVTAEPVLTIPGVAPLDITRLAAAFDRVGAEL
jgi:phosphoribosylformylglycinamidine synthase